MNTFLDTMQQALDSHDPHRLAALFAEDYRSAQPAHPGREFVGRPKVLENWTAVFAGVPDFAATLVSAPDALASGFNAIATSWVSAWPPSLLSAS